MEHTEIMIIVKANGGYAIKTRRNGITVERRLRWPDGTPIKASPGVTHIEHETNPKIAYEVSKASAHKFAEIQEEGALVHGCSWTYGAAMKKYLDWHSKRRNNKQKAGHAKRSTTKLGHIKIKMLTRKEVVDWIEDLERYISPKTGGHLSHNTIKHAVDCGKNLYNWLRKQDFHKGENPFLDHEWKAKGEGLYQKPTVSPEELRLILELAKPSPQTSQAVVLGYYTGGRPSENFRIYPEDFNHRDLTLTLHSTKKGVKDRLIAIPQTLSDWARTHEWVKMNENSIQHRLSCIAKQHPSLTGLCMETFRNNFERMMEDAGVSPVAYYAHLDHNQDKIDKSYPGRDPMRAVKLMREPLMKVFGKPVVTVYQVADGGSLVAGANFGRQSAT